MRLIIAGSRCFEDPATLEEAFQKLSEDCDWPEITEVVSGTARGVDRLGEAWAAQRGIPVKRFPADWAVHGKTAGFIRNALMVEYVAPDGALLAIYDGTSAGTHDVINRAKRRKLLHYIYCPMPDPEDEEQSSKSKRKKQKEQQS